MTANPLPEDQQKGEPTLWFQRFTSWLHQEKPRSVIEEVNRGRDRQGHKRTANVPTSWRKRVEQFQWYARAEAYDQAELAREAAEREAARQRRMEGKLKAEADQRTREIEDAVVLRDKGLAVLSLSHQKQRSRREEDNGKMTIIEIAPARSSEFYAATKMLETAHKLARAALEMPQETRKVEVDWKQEAQRYGVDPESLINTLAVIMAEQIAARSETEDRAGSSHGSFEAPQNGAG